LPEPLPLPLHLALPRPMLLPLRDPQLLLVRLLLLLLLLSLLLLWLLLLRLLLLRLLLLRNSRLSTLDSRLSLLEIGVIPHVQHRPPLVNVQDLVDHAI